MDDRSPVIRSIQSFLAANAAKTGLFVAGTFEIRTLGEAEKLATMLSMNYPDPTAVSVGIWELLSNAIEHGNLGIDFATKSRLLSEGGYEQELNRRLTDPRYHDRVARVDFRRLRKALKLRIADAGDGFDPTPFLQGGEDGGGQCARRPNGRGICIARELSFDKLTYEGRGNIVVALVTL